MHLTALGTTKNTEEASKGFLHLKGLQSRAGHSREKHPLVVGGGGAWERNTPNGENGPCKGPEEAKSKTKKAGKQWGEPDREKSARLEELLCSVCGGVIQIFLRARECGSGNFLLFLFCCGRVSLSRLG